MIQLIACIGCMLVPGVFQQPTVTLAQSPTGLRVVWTAPPGPRINNWIGILLASKPDNTLDIPGAWYKYLPLEGENGTMDFGTPVAGEYEARYFAGNSGPLVTRSPKITVGALPVDPVDPPPPDDTIPQPNVPWRLDAKIVKADGTEVVSLPVYHFSWNELTSDRVRREELLAVGEVLHWQAFRGKVVYEETPKFVGSTRNAKE